MTATAVPYGPKSPILIYDRIDSNRRRTRLLQGVLPLAILPWALYVVQYLMASIAMGSMMAVSTGVGAPEENLSPLFVSGAAAIGLVVAATVLVYRTSASLLLRLTGARFLAGDEEPLLSRVVENLCIGSGIPRPRLAVIESAAANAYSTGLSPESSTLVVTRGLLELLDHRELEGVVAQELSQIGNEDVRLGTIMAAAVTMLWLPYLLVRRVFRKLRRSGSRLGMLVVGVVVLQLGGSIAFAIVAGLGSGLTMLLGSAESNAFAEVDPMLGIVLISAMLIGLYALVGAPVVGMLIRRADSRAREFRADADAALLTRYPPGLARALSKMKAADNSMSNAEPSIAHLWIVDPLPGNRSLWSRIWSIHPPLAERIEVLSRMGGVTP
jgi:heat shock protein HtpX